MKGIVVDCLKQLVVGSFGADKWAEIAKACSVKADAVFAADSDLEDEMVLKMFSTTCERTGLSFEQACDAYGAFWAGSYIPKRYSKFYEGVTSTKEFLLRLDAVHAKVPQMLPNARPPRHGYKWANDHTLVMSYDSHRDLIVLLIGSIKGVAKYYNDKIDVRMLDRKHAEITFLS